MLAHAVSTSVRDRIEVLLLRAHGADDESSLDLVRASTRPRRARWLRPHLRRRGTLARAVCAAARRHLADADIAAEIAAAIVAEPDRRASLQDLGELSDREQEVWRFLSTSLSMQEIADALYVSRNTLEVTRAQHLPEARRQHS